MRATIAEPRESRKPNRQFIFHHAELLDLHGCMLSCICMILQAWQFSCDRRHNIFS